jgi:DNA gyrase subunit B
MENKNINYNQDSIVSLSAGAAFRSKIGMYLSADRQEAINLGLRELIVNVQDEYEVYKPKNPFLKINLDTKRRLISVEDNMRGIPVGIRKDGMNSLTAAFLVPHSGGKHSEGAYSSAVGINGEGNKVVCHTAEWLKVEVKRDGKIYRQEFESTDEGAKATTDVMEFPGTSSTGTYIIYKPDDKVYGGCFIDIDALRTMLTEISYFTIGLKIILIVDGEEEVFLCKNGLIDGLNHPKPISKPFSYFYETEDCKVELALQWVEKRGEIRGYANGLYMPDGGAFITGFKTSLTKVFNNLGGTKFSGEQIRDVLDGFVSVKVRMGQFSNQAKTALANPEARTAASTAITNAIKDFASKHAAEFNKVVELLNKVAKAEVAAENARKKVLESTKEIERNQKRKVFASDKLKDAEFLGEGSTLLIVEGDSALGGIAQARDYTKYGILAIRGKIINCLANTEEDIFDNEEIKLLLSAMNIVPGSYNSKKLRYGKIGICVDADSDGGHIALLIMAALYKLAPEFIREGRLCWLHSPLYIVTNGTKETYYYTDEEFDKVRGKISGTVTRAKGLGELSAETAKQSMFTAPYQRLEILNYTSQGVELLSQLMGDDSDLRRDYIIKNIDFSTIRE